MAAAGTAAAIALVLACGGGGDGGGGTGPVPVASVVITSPATAPSFGTLGRTLQFAAEARGASGTVLAGRAITWASSNTAVASVSSSAGLVTAVANGTAQITASSEGVPSAPVGVTVNAVANSVVITPPSVAFGAVGSSRQLTASVLDSGSTTIPGRTVTWSRSGAGTTATVSGSGLVTSVAVGSGDAAVATASGPAGPITASAPITVTQVVNTIAVTGSLLPDTLKTTGSTKQFAASAADSNLNTIPGKVFTWTSTSSGVATVDINSGLVTAVSDGSASIQASVDGKTGSRTMVVRRYAATFSLAPTSPPAITTSGGTQVFTGTAQDSVGTNLPISWLSRTTTVATVSPATGTSTTATAVANGTTRIVMSGGTRLDSATLTVSLPVSFASDVQPIFTANCALTGCHTGANPTGSLNLSAGQSRTQLVNVAAVGFPGATRVIPGDASNSYLIRKLEGGPNISGVRMPEGAPALPTATIQKIRDWITAGALNN